MFKLKYSKALLNQFESTYKLHFQHNNLNNMKIHYKAYYGFKEFIQAYSLRRMNDFIETSMTHFSWLIIFIGLFIYNPQKVYSQSLLWNYQGFSAKKSISCFYCLTYYRRLLTLLIGSVNLDSLARRELGENL